MMIDTHDLFTRADNFTGSIQHLTRDAFMHRARTIRLVLTDNDGVLTDGGVYYSERGEELKRYSIRDGMGVERLRAHGIETGIMTGEVSPNLVERARKLKITELHLGVKDKTAALEILLEERGLTVHDIAYIGDDINDHAVMTKISQHGLTFTPADAMPAIRALAQYVCGAPGGRGAFRDAAEALIALGGHRPSML